MGCLMVSCLMNHATLESVAQEVEDGEVTPLIIPKGTLRMAGLLARARAEASANPERNPFMSDELLMRQQAGLKAAIEASDWDRAMNLHMMYAMQLLNSGKSEPALQAFKAWEVNAGKLGFKPQPEMQRQLSLLKAMCHLRIGEQENCLAHHTTESCLFPIQEAGVHKIPRGSLGAVQALTQHLNEFRGDMSARWLLNIAYMTLGEYPKSVPADVVIPPSVFNSDHDIGRFPDVAGALGLDTDELAGGAIIEDFDGDGFLDVMTSAWGLSGQLRLYRNNGDGTFTERTHQAGLTGLHGGLHIVQTDYNNDGFPDVFVLRGAWLGDAGKHPNSLLKNNGDGTFEDVTEAAGLLSFHPTQTAAWFDFDGDGWLDVFIGNESTPDSYHPCELYRNNGDGTFTECSWPTGTRIAAFVKGVTAGDYNNDGRPDLYLSVRNGPNILLRNEGAIGEANDDEIPWRFVETTWMAGVAGPEPSFTTWFFDYDNDGWQDLFVSGYYITSVGDIAADYLGLPGRGTRAKLYRNNRDGTFSDLSKETNLDKVIHTMGAAYGDLDNDGWLDFYAATGDPELSTLVPNRMFRNDEGGGFHEVTSSGGFGHLQKGHGVVFADFDNDGDQDVYVNMGGAYTGDNYRNALFLNPGHGNHWLTLKLEGVESNRAAIGARIRVVVAVGSGERSIYRTVNNGTSFGNVPFRQEFGLGKASSVLRVEIFWPATGQTQVLKNIAMDRFYTIREGESAAKPWRVKKIQISAK